MLQSQGQASLERSNSSPKGSSTIKNNSQKPVSSKMTVRKKNEQTSSSNLNHNSVNHHPNNHRKHSSTMHHSTATQARQDFAAMMNEDLKEFGNHLNLAKQKKKPTGKPTAVTHKFVTTTTKRSPRHAAYANISRVSLNYQKYGQNRSQQEPQQQASSSTRQQNPHQQQIITSTTTAHRQACSSQQSQNAAVVPSQQEPSPLPKQQQSQQESQFESEQSKSAAVNLRIQGNNSTINNNGNIIQLEGSSSKLSNGSKYVQQKRSRVHSWAMNYIKMEHARKTAQKSQFLTNNVVRPVPELLNSSRRIKASLGSSQLKLLTSHEDSPEPLNETSFLETPKFSSNPPIYNRQAARELQKNEGEKTIASGANEEYQVLVAPESHRWHTQKLDFSKLKGQGPESSAASPSDKSKSKMELDALKQFLSYQKSRIDDSNLELYRASAKVSTIPLLANSSTELERVHDSKQQQQRHSQSFLKMARAEQLKMQKKLPQLVARPQYDSQHIFIPASSNQMTLDKSGPFLAGQKKYVKPTSDRFKSNALLGGAHTSRQYRNGRNDDLKSVLPPAKSPSTGGGDTNRDQSGLSPSRYLQQEARPLSIFKLPSKISATTLEQDLQNIVNRQQHVQLQITKKMQKLQLEGHPVRDTLSQAQVLIKSKYFSKNGRNSVQLPNRSNSMQYSPKNAEIKKGQVVLIAPNVGNSSIAAPSTYVVHQKHQAAKARQFMVVAAGSKRLNSLGGGVIVASDQQNKSYQSGELVPEMVSKKSSSQKVPLTVNKHIQQIQVHGADLVYLAQRKVHKKRLPSILVNQAKRGANLSRSTQQNLDLSIDGIIFDQNEQSTSQLLKNNPSFQRKVELHWSKNKKVATVAGEAVVQQNAKANTRTQSVSPTAQIYDFDAYLSNQLMFSMETNNSNSFVSSNQEGSPPTRSKQHQQLSKKQKTQMQQHSGEHMLIKGEQSNTNNNTDRSREEDQYKQQQHPPSDDALLQPLHPLESNSIASPSKDTVNEQPIVGKGSKRQQQHHYQNGLTSKQKFKLRFDRTEQTRMILKANEESVNSGFSLRVQKTQQNLSMQDYLKHGTAAAIAKAQKATAAAGQSLQSFHSSGGEDANQFQDSRMQSSKRATLGQDESLNIGEVANLSAQLQQEVESIQVTGHQSQMQFRRRTQSKQFDEKILVGKFSPKKSSVLTQTQPHVLVTKQDSLDELMHRGPYDLNRLVTGCDNSSIDNDERQSRRSERSRLLSRESLTIQHDAQITNGQREASRKSQGGASVVKHPIPIYSNIPIQQLEVDFNKKSSGDNTPFMQSVTTEMGRQRTVPMHKRSKRGGSHLRKSSKSNQNNQLGGTANNTVTNKQVFPVPNIPAVARVNQTNYSIQNRVFNQTLKFNNMHQFLVAANNTTGNESASVFKLQSSQQLQTSQQSDFGVQTVNGFPCPVEAHEPQITTKYSRKRTSLPVAGGVKHSATQSRRESQDGGGTAGSNSATINVTVPNAAATTSKEAVDNSNFVQQGVTMMQAVREGENSAEAAMATSKRLLLKDHILHRTAGVTAVEMEVMARDTLEFNKGYSCSSNQNTKTCD